MNTQRVGSANRPVETVATFWAHYDDDLIFANPTVQHSLDRGQRTRSFFFTAGDAGTGMSEYVDGERPASVPPTTTCAERREPGRIDPWCSATA